jgi:hypothetical protein
VRGPLSARLLGLPPETAIADGAVLAPLCDALPAKGGQATRRGVIIPHWKTLDYPGWDEVARLTGHDLLDPRGDPIAVISRIADADFVLTESLHGAILADLYGVPWGGFATTANFLPAKWLDWALSCGRDLHLTAVPPPTALPLLVQGRPSARFGDQFTVDAEQAFAALRSQTSGPPRPPTMMQRGKALLKTGAVSQALIVRSGLIPASPERTAEALGRLATRLETPTAPAVIARQQDRMLSRLEAFRRARQSRSAGLVPSC